MILPKESATFSSCRFNFLGGLLIPNSRFYYDFCEFMVENYSATPDQLTLDWNCVGAIARYHGQNRAFELRLWERSDGHLGIPDMTVIVSVLYISGLVANAQ